MPSSNGANDDETQAVLECNQRLLTGIVDGNYFTYDGLCSDDMTCIEPESNNQVVVGKAFHKYYFDLYGRPSTPVLVSMVRPLVQFMGGDKKVAVVTYIRLNQIKKADGMSETTQTSETRVWEKDESGNWKNRHFHKS
jgi:ketosteroid isomerase-like protein